MSEHGAMTASETLRSAEATAEGWRRTCAERDQEILTLRECVAELSRAHVDAAGHPWGRFLRARHVLILWMREQGRSHEEIFDVLEMDVGQVRLIAATPMNEADPYTLWRVGQPKETGS